MKYSTEIGPWVVRVGFDVFDGFDRSKTKDGQTIENFTTASKEWSRKSHRISGLAS